MSTHFLFRGHTALLSGCMLIILLSLGCKPKPAADAPAADVANEPAEPAEPSEPAEPASTSTTPVDPPADPPTFELSGEDLLAARLPADETAEGWVRLFDGSTLFGWQITDTANWRVEDGAIVVDAGQRSFLATTSTWDNYELKLEFQADAKTNSGVFLRTQLHPESVATDCYELNIAPPDNPFPTGSLVERQRVEPEEVGEIDPAQWHSYHVRVDDQTITVQLDGKEILRYEDPNRVPAGLISLQHREGRVAFRDIRIRPLGLQPLLAGDDLAQWKQHPEYEGEFTIDDESNLSIKGGSGQLESRAQFGDFALLARCRTNAKDLNSGIFFRCIPGEKMNGYECQISNETVDGDPLKPGDAGTGGIFRRQPARIVAGEDQQWVSILLVANGPTMMAWVNGLQVSDWTDTRDPDPNPRRGLRVEPGTLMLQAHDPTTDLSFSDISVAPIGPAPEPAWPSEE
ncbi:3-keto-disaccharide hydrolase [Roseimaritima ulvae]|uniref:3-keto-alpha-glucoside-1,2-lyase/3-keto-2-hydroxy-glucal hydratase domain-containing protein n=1 Tax=Roseimaritima ulvae TaxID=980254 RepID=A0A5B9R957_9BACT|nr:DUF1080 domain-containing protein [Roseimaritima ulvae]QEG43303.1 hypothetical protein UC8_53500 [Roseimaritima ulvae]